MADLVEVFRSANGPEAQLLAAALNHHGVRATVVQGGLAAVVGAGSFAVPARVLVPADQEADARVAIEMLSAEPAAGTSPDECGACGAPWEPGFQECWRCQAPL